MTTPATTGGNFGPSFGCGLVVLCDRLTPRPLEHAVIYPFAFIGLVLARRNIRHSRAYLTTITGRPASIFTVWKHYQRMIYGVARKLRAARGLAPAFALADEAAAAEFMAVAASEEPMLFGTFHVGDSDMLGCMMAERFSRKLSMVRTRVGNSADTDRLADKFGAHVEFVWVNDPGELLFGIKRAMDAGRSLAVQCDREDHASRTAYFRFLGARRRFPVTLYALAALFQKPVAFAFAMPAENGESVVYTAPVFRPESDATREAVMAAGEAHFQGVLDLLETQLRRDPFRWFNFTPLPEVEPENTAGKSA